MKPEDFILNTDYLSLSTAANTTRQVTFAGGTVASLNFSNQTLDLTVPKVNQASFQYMISEDNTNWYPTSIYNFDYNCIFTLFLYRILHFKILQILIKKLTFLKELKINL